MRNIFVFSFLFLCEFFLLAPASFSQETNDQLFWVREEIVKIEMWNKYESAAKDWVKLMTGAGLDCPYMQASQRDDGHYYYLFPLDNYSAIDKMPEIFGAAIEKIGKDKWQKFMIENESSIATHKDFIAKRSAKYSYMPKSPRLKPEEVKFLHWMFFHFKLENRNEVMEIMTEWKRLYEEKILKTDIQSGLLNLDCITI